MQHNAQDFRKMKSQTYNLKITIFEANKNYECRSTR